MKLALAALAFSAACTDTYSQPCTTCGGPQPIGTVGSCTQDSDCGPGNVCARDENCYASFQVRSAAVLWTLQHQPASSTTCATTPDLQLDFIDDVHGASFGFAPVPCVEGRFSVDKLPTIYVAAQLGSTSSPGAVQGAIDATSGQVTLDLPY